MEYRKLGKTGIDVSVICLGTMTYGEQNNEQEAHEQLDYAIERGINFIDTAEVYAIPINPETQGLTEQYVGSWLAGRGDRDKIVLASKVVGPGVGHIRGGAQLTREHITKAVEGSLSRLHTDYLDLYQVHWPARNANFFSSLDYVADMDEDLAAEEATILETLETLSDLVKQGKIRSVGLSNETPWGTMRHLQLADKFGLARVASVQNPYSLLNRSYEVGLAEVSHREQIGLLAYSPLGFGVLTGKYEKGAMPENARLTRWTDYFPRYRTEEGQLATTKYVELAKAHGMTPTQLALAFVNTRPFVAANIIGATTMEQLKENIDSWQTEISDEVMAGINEIHQQHCNPCP
ncbi:NADP(H)-dependent aldo-keto reductase [Leucothrix arctica]|uniref:Protein tas n=1 Tax=Leucothrix arctica TaxID=1481894 RepID=A0A317CK70_9GAMM|nr:NADP(H)-dependent aldo-keto reductase [Leucothrix arctica]PWQ98896.1 NADP(H)-dependent aldo-keto reductase [Leucothrix arctica]